MKNSKLLGRGLLQALAAAIYIALVAILMQNANQIFGQTKKIVGPLAFLLLFVFSALVTGSLILAKPVMLYLDGQKKDGFRLFLYTGIGLFIILLISFGIMAIWK